MSSQARTNSIEFGLNTTSFLIWRQDLVQNVHRLLRSCVFRWVTFDSIRIKILHHNTAQQCCKRDSFSSAGTYDPSKTPSFSRQVNRELTNFTIRIFWIMCQNIAPASWLARVWSLGPLLKKNIWMAASSSALRLSPTTLCESWSLPQGTYSKY